MSDPYLYPNSSVLVNKFGVEDAAALDDLERFHVAQRQAEGVPTGDFSSQHLKAIHGHLFQDVYEWAGEFREVEMSKTGNQFQFASFVENGVDYVHGKIQEKNYLRGSTRDEFVSNAADIIGDLNYAHPFREGNGRTQKEYLEQLSEKAGHPLDISRLHGDQWIEASKESYHKRLEPMKDILDSALIHSEHAPYRNPDQEPDLEQ